MKDIIAFYIRAENIEWINDFNRTLEKKHKIKIGVSRIIDMIIENVKLNERGIERLILNDKKVDLGVKAFNNYLKEKERIGKVK